MGVRARGGYRHLVAGPDSWCNLHCATCDCARYVGKGETQRSHRSHFHSTVCAACQTLVAKSIGKDQQNWNKAIQARVQNTSHILGSMRSIKISGYAESVSADIQNQRIEELETSRPFFRGILCLNVLCTCSLKTLPLYH